MHRQMMTAASASPSPTAPASWSAPSAPRTSPRSYPASSRRRSVEATESALNAIVPRLCLTMVPFRYHLSNSTARSRRSTRTRRRHPGDRRSLL